MGKYSLNLVISYLNGDDMINYSPEVLEDNPAFMKQVIKYTNDYKLYNLCSEDVKSSYFFVKYIIKKFSDNLEFVTKVGDYFLNKSNNINESIDIIFILNELTIYDNNINKKYNDLLKMIYYNNSNLYYQSINKIDSCEPFSNRAILKKVNDIIDICKYYMEDTSGLINTELMILYVASEFGLIEIFENELKTLYNKANTEFINNTLRISLIDIMTYNYIRDMFSNIILGDKTIDNYIINNKNNMERRRKK